MPKKIIYSKNQVEKDRFNYTVLNVEPKECNFRGTDEDNPVICRTFGCRKKLSLNEQRFGNVCVHCANKLT